MKTNTITISILTMLIMASTACSSTNSMENKLVGEWQSTKSRDGRLKITNVETNSKGVHTSFSSTEGGENKTYGWVIDQDSKYGTVLVLEGAGYWADYQRRTGLPGAAESWHRIVELTQQRLVIDWNDARMPQQGTRLEEYRRIDPGAADRSSAETNAPQPSPTSAPPQPLAECTTPCSMNVGWGTTISTGGRPVWAKFSGKKERFLFSGRKDGPPIPRDKFSPGMTEFTSPDSTPVQVQLLPPG